MPRCRPKAATDPHPQRRQGPGQRVRGPGMREARRGRRHRHAGGELVRRSEGPHMRRHLQHEMPGRSPAEPRASARRGGQNACRRCRIARAIMRTGSPARTQTPAQISRAGVVVSILGFEGRSWWAAENRLRSAISANAAVLNPAGFHELDERSQKLRSFPVGSDACSVFQQRASNAFSGAFPAPRTEAGVRRAQPDLAAGEQSSETTQPDHASPSILPEHSPQNLPVSRGLRP